MNRYALALPAIAAASLLAACAAPDANYRAPSATPMTSAPVAGYTLPYQPGTGVVESVTQAPAPLSASAGATATPARGEAARGASAGDTWYRLGVRMDNGRMQYIDTNSRDYTVGTRIELTEDRLIRRR